MRPTKKSCFLLYYSQMHIKSPLLKQALGGIAGMAVAVLLYYGFEALQLFDPRALLLNQLPQTETDFASNRKDLDADTVNRLAERAKRVAEQIAAAQDGSSPKVIAVNPAVTERRLRRQEMRANTSMTSDTQPVEVTRRERVEQRMDRLDEMDDELHGGAPLQPDSLSNTGPLTNALVVIAALIAFGMSGMTRKLAFAFAQDRS